MLIYNTLGRKKEEFVPAQAGKANMYVCGITAYDLCHIGHARSALVFDVFSRQLRHMGLEVRFVRNFTDVDDKIINRANKEGRDWREVAGQLPRILAALLFSRVWGPLGNTGRARVSAFQPMPLSDELKRLLG